jgi:hypothetical protein
MTNISLPFTAIGGDEPEENILEYTVSRIKIPQNIGLKHVIYS